MSKPDRLQELLLMLEKEPSDSFLNYALAVEYQAKGELEKAIVQLQLVLLNDANYLGAYYQLGQLFEKINSIEKAKNTYEAGIEKAKLLKKNKTLNELREALSLLEDE